MGLKETIDEMIVLCLYVGYAVYVVCGIISIIVGVFYYTEIDDQIDSMVTKITFSVGIFMILCGGVALLAVRKKKWLWLFVLEIVNVILFVVLLTAGFIALCLALEIRNPVKVSVHETWHLPGAGRNEHEIINYCKLHAGDKCTAYYESLAEIKLRVNVIVSSAGKGGMKCAALKESDNWEACDESVLRCRESISPWIDKAGDSWNCSQALDTKLWCTPVVEKTNTDPDDSFKKDFSVSTIAVSCMECDKACQAKVVEEIEAHLKPASAFAFVVFTFLVITIFVNNIVVHLATMDGLHEDGLHGIGATMSYFLNGMVCLSAIGLLVLGGYGMNMVDKKCAEVENMHEDCTSWAIIALLMLGCALFLVSALVLLGIKKSSNMLAIDIIRICQLVYLVIGFVLLLCTIAFAISAGLMEHVNKGYQKASAKIVVDLKKAKPDFCTKGNPPVEMSELECLNKGEKYIRDKTESNFKAVGIMAMIVMGFMAIVIYFTERAVKAFHREEDDDMIDGDNAVGDSSAPGDEDEV